MQIHFSPVEQGDSANDIFTHNNVEYYYSLEVDDECVSIKDTCGRMVLLSITDIKYLMNALVAADYYTAPIVLAEDARNKVNSTLVLVA